MEENVIQINGGIMINVDTSVKNVMYEEDYFGNPAACNRENGKHSSSIMDDWAIICDEIIKSCNEDADADAEAKSYNEIKTKISIFY